MNPNPLPDRSSVSPIPDSMKLAILDLLHPRRIRRVPGWVALEWAALGAALWWCLR